MKQFEIFSENYLNQTVKGFYHEDYRGGGSYKISGTIENLICTFKNDITPYTNDVLKDAMQRLTTILKEDLSEILKVVDCSNITVCVVPRAKNENFYQENQKLFRQTVRSVVSQLPGFEDGTQYIERHTNTITTHRDKWGFGGDGKKPYPGITKETCSLSDEIIGKDILLIDDIYTRSINIDEDAIQALLDKGANSVIFYAIGKTVFGQYNL